LADLSSLMCLLHPEVKPCQVYKTQNTNALNWVYFSVTCFNVNMTSGHGCPLLNSCSSFSSSRLLVRYFDIIFVYFQWMYSCKIFWSVFNYLAIFPVCVFAKRFSIPAINFGPPYFSVYCWYCWYYLSSCFLVLPFAFEFLIYLHLNFIFAVYPCWAAFLPLEYRV
jgi:hypothetical protein